MLENLGADELRKKRFTPEELVTIVSPQTLSNLCWCLAKLNFKAINPIYDKLDKVIMYHIKYFK